jgi:hypothetical protein
MTRSQLYLRAKPGKRDELLRELDRLEVFAAVREQPGFLACRVRKFHPVGTRAARGRALVVESISSESGRGRLLLGRVVAVPAVSACAGGRSAAFALAPVQGARDRGAPARARDCSAPSLPSAAGGERPGLPCRGQPDNGPSEPVVLRPSRHSPWLAPPTRTETVDVRRTTSGGPLFRKKSVCWCYVLPVRIRLGASSG